MQTYLKNVILISLNIITDWSLSIMVTFEKYSEMGVKQSQNR
jgi:hypothetical protein